jgi:hypothetical protein
VTRIRNKSKLTRSDACEDENKWRLKMYLGLVRTNGPILLLIIPSARSRLHGSRSLFKVRPGLRYTQMNRMNNQLSVLVAPSSVGVRVSLVRFYLQFELKVRRRW